MQVEVDIINAFTKHGGGGNPAGVVLGLSKNSLSNKEMQAIARQMNLSETAFVLPSSKKRERGGADYCVRFYAVNAEVGLCGHATIAAWADLYQKGIINTGEYIQEIKTGRLRVGVGSDGRIIMDQPLPAFRKKLAITDIARVLDIPSEWVSNTNLTPQVVSTGLNDLIIPIDTREHLFAVQLNDILISDFERKNELDSFHIFTLDTVETESLANSRNADPFHGIHEESATGSAHGALASYLFHHGIITEKQAAKGLVFEQGYNMKSPSEIFVRLEVLHHEIKRVQVGGLATVKKTRTIEI